MKRLENNRIGIDQGDVNLFSDYETGGEMWTGDGPRKRLVGVSFSERFASVPVVQCSLSMIDVDSATNVRTDVKAANITETGFEIVFKTWGDTRFARARVSWTAFGELTHEDSWDLY